MYKIQTCRHGSAAELCTNSGLIICPLNYHVALMRLQGWIIHFQPNFLLNWLSWSFSECEPLWQLGYLTSFFRFRSENLCLWIKGSLSSVLGLSTSFKTPNWVSVAVWIVIFMCTVQHSLCLKKKYCSMNVNCYLCRYPAPRLFSCIPFMNVSLLTGTFSLLQIRRIGCE